jgi:hypothetical protein
MEVRSKRTVERFLGTVGLGTGYMSSDSRNVGFGMSAVEVKADLPRTSANIGFWRRVQLIAATHSANFSAGV